METRSRKVSPLKVLFESAAIAGLVTHLGVAFHSWRTLPNIIPVHFGITGQPDKWESKGELWVLPALGLVIYVGLTILGRYAHKFNYPWEITPANAERQFQMARVVVSAVKALTMWLFAIITWQTVRVAMNQASGLGFLIPAVIIVSTFTIVVYLWLGSRAS